MRVAAVLLALAPGLCLAQVADETLPGYTIPGEEIQRFADCRAAVIYHLDGEPDPASRVPRSLALALRDQINFVMSETLLGRPVTTIDEGQRLAIFMERWFLTFGQTIATQAQRMRDASARDEKLLECAPIVWSAARPLIEQLYAWRSKATNPPQFRTDAELDEGFRRMDERLELPRR